MMGEGNGRERGWEIWGWGEGGEIGAIVAEGGRVEGVGKGREAIMGEGNGSEGKRVGGWAGGQERGGEG